MSTRFQSRRHRFTPVLAVGAITATAVLGALAGPAGIVAGMCAALAAVWVGPIAGVAFAHIAAVLLLASPSTLELVAFELGVAPLLATPLVDRPAGLDVAVLAGSLLGLAGLVLAGPRIGDLWLVAGAVACAVALVGYGLHRYERVVLGLVADDADLGDANSPRDETGSHGGDA